MLNFIRLCFVFVLMVNEIICRSIDSNTVPTIIDDANQMNVTSTMADVIMTTITEPPPRTFDICEHFNDQNEMDVLKLRDRGITVVTKLF